MKKTIIPLVASCACSLCAQSVEVSQYGKTAAGEQVEQYTLKNASGMTIKAITYGAIVTDLIVADKNGDFDNVLLNLSDIAAYEADKGFMGPVVGRYGNRLNRSQFTISGKTYTVSANEGKNSLHGGVEGFNKKIWKAKKLQDEAYVGVEFSRVSPDGEMGYPGNMAVAVTYKLTNQNEFIIEYKATTDKPTVCNLTWHPYFNLAGAGNGNVLTHHFYVAADRFTPVNNELIPTGEQVSVRQTPFDFTQASVTIGERLLQKHPQLDIKMGGGAFDHNFVLNKPVDAFGTACIVYNPKNGRKLHVQTEEPCLQFYSGQGFDGTIKGANGKPYYKFAGFVIEPQHHPDQPNQPNFFPPTLLVPGEVFTSKSVYAFSTVGGKGK